MTVLRILSHRRPPIILAVFGVLALVVFVAQPVVAHAADANSEPAFVLNTFAFLV